MFITHIMNVNWAVNKTVNEYIKEFFLIDISPLSIFNLIVNTNYEEVCTQAMLTKQINEVEWLLAKFDLSLTNKVNMLNEMKE